MSANQGDPLAQYWLAYCYYYGHGILENEIEAAKWLLLAAEQGDPLAQYGMGDCFYYGINNTAVFSSLS